MKTLADPMDGRLNADIVLIDGREATRRLAYVMAIQALPPQSAPATILAAIKEAGTGLGLGRLPSIRTVQRWRLRLRANGGDARCLVPTRRHDPRSTMLPWMLHIAREEAARADTRERPTVRFLTERAHRQIAARILQEGLPVTMPSHAAVLRAVRSCLARTWRPYPAPRGAFAATGTQKASAKNDALGIDAVMLRDRLGGAGILTVARQLADGRAVAAVLAKSVDAAGALGAACGQAADPTGGGVIRWRTSSPKRVVVDNDRAFHTVAFREAARALGLTVDFRCDYGLERCFERLRRDVAVHCPPFGSSAASDYLRRWFDTDDAAWLGQA